MICSLGVLDMTLNLHILITSYDKNSSYGKNMYYDGNNQNLRGRSNFVHSRLRGNTRHLRNREWSYNRNRSSRDRDNRGGFNRNRSRKDSRSRSRGKLTSRDKSEERRCYYYREPGYFIKEC